MLSFFFLLQLSFSNSFSLYTKATFLLYTLLLLPYYSVTVCYYFEYDLSLSLNRATTSRASFRTSCFKLFVNIFDRWGACMNALQWRRGLNMYTTGVFLFFFFFSSFVEKGKNNTKCAFLYEHKINYIYV